ncbi:unnamed protein product, partial [Meganyctiphanes norvegica]
MTGFHNKNHGATIIQKYFTHLLMPIYYQAMSKANQKAGFEACGLYPWYPYKPDYSKLRRSDCDTENYEASFTIGISREPPAYPNPRAHVVDRTSQTNTSCSITQSTSSNLCYTRPYTRHETMCDMKKMKKKIMNI